MLNPLTLNRLKHEPFDDLWRGPVGARADDSSSDSISPEPLFALPAVLGEIWQRGLRGLLKALENARYNAWPEYP